MRAKAIRIPDSESESEEEVETLRVATEQEKSPAHGLQSPTSPFDETPGPPKQGILTPTDGLPSPLMSHTQSRNHPESTDPMRKAMARSIIAGLLESLLLSAALSNESVMQDVIEWNTENPIQEKEPGEMRQRQKRKPPQPRPKAVATDRPNKSNFIPGTNTIDFSLNEDEDRDDSGVAVTQPPVASTRSTIAQKIVQSLKTAKLRGERREDYEPPPPPKRLKSPTPPPPPSPRTKLTEPLSELTKDWEVPLEDIEAYVNRPISVRQSEVEKSKDPGRVKRPLNSFMLYRKAYQHRAKEYGLMNDHQVVSQICADSWAVEVEEVKEMFAAWGRIERARHEDAHPGYKFCPVKAATGMDGVEDED